VRNASTDHEGRQFWVAPAERVDVERFVVHAHDCPLHFLELQAAIHGQLELGLSIGKLIAGKLIKADWRLGWVSAH
jgi:hypothetical protein